MNDLDALAAEIRRRIEAKKAAEKPKPTKPSVQNPEKPARKKKR